MSLTGTTVDITYTGNGSTTDFPIPFAIHENSQVFVKLLDTTTTPAGETILVEGSDYNILGGNPGTTVECVVAPTATEELYLYRITPRTQITDYIETGAFKAEDHEKALDRIVMMMQEIDAGIVATSGAGGGKFTRLSSQSVSVAGTVTIGTAQRMLKNVQGDGAAVIADLTTPIEAGQIDGQEIRLVGASDTDTLTLLNSGNLVLNGSITFGKNTVLDIFWVSADNNWVEMGRNL